MHLHLLSSPGEDPLQDVVHAVAPFLSARTNPLIAYLPAASEVDQAAYLGLTENAFSGLAQVELVDLVARDLREALSVLSQSSLVYVPGGNTYLLASRLRSTGLFEHLQSRLRAGLPFAAFSAGTVLVGSSIAMSNDENLVALQDTSGLGLVPFTIAVHYPSGDGEGLRSFRARLQAYIHDGQPPVLALEDGAYLHVEDNALTLVRGKCYRFDERADGEILAIGTKMAAA